MNNRNIISKQRDWESNLGDFGVRKYESFSGRFTSVDPLYEKYYGWSPYVYSANNPVIFFDPNGLNWFTNTTGEVKWFDQQGDFSEIKDEITWQDIGEKLTWDLVSDKRVLKLDKRIQYSTVLFIRKSEVTGFQLRITTGFRSFEEQANEYAKGRNIPGKKTTNAKPGYSYHNYGLAIDVVQMVNGKPIWKILPENIIKIAKNLGFEWGGKWKNFPDYPHFQMTFGLSINELLKINSDKK